MSQIQTIFKNMSWLLISQIIACICAFIWTILIARYLGVYEYGILGFAISLTTILSFTTDLGIGTHIIRHISVDHESAPKYLGNAIPLKCIFAIVTLTLSLISLILLNADELTLTITLLFTIEIIIKSYINFFNSTFQAFEIAKYQGISSSFLNIILLLFILISIFTDLGIYGITFSYLGANVLALIYIYYSLRKYVVQPRYEFDRKFCKNITLVSIPFAIGGLLYLVYYSIDVVMLTNIVGSYATGVYNASYKLISVLTLFYSVYTAVIFPIMSKFFENDEKLLIISFERSIKYLMMIMIPIAIVTTFYSSDIILLIYGSEYSQASSVLSILIWTVCFLFVSGACNTLLNASHKEVTVSKIYLFAAIFNIVLNFFMIPYFSYNGAAITTVLSDMLIVIIQAYVIYKLNYKPNKKLYFDLVKIILGSCVLGIILYVLNLNMWLAMFLGIIIYLITILIFKVFDEDDKYIIKEILGKNT